MLGIADATNGWRGLSAGSISRSRHTASILNASPRHPKFKGVRPMIQDLPDDDWMLRPKLDWAFRALIETGVHFEALGFPRHLDNFLTIFLGAILNSPSSSTTR